MQPSQNGNPSKSEEISLLQEAIKSTEKALEVTIDPEERRMFYRILCRALSRLEALEIEIVGRGETNV